MFPGLVHTARHVTKVGNARSRWPNPFWEGAVEGAIGDWDEVVTRQPYRKVRLGRLLSKGRAPPVPARGRGAEPRPDRDGRPCSGGRGVFGVVLAGGTLTS